MIIGINQAQQMPLYSQYMLNGFLLNPGMTGNVD
ncbi:MAG: type IX secretion system membrane protein PorP/SprF, partial [Bacteroidota bacterium]